MIKVNGINKRYLKKDGRGNRVEINALKDVDYDLSAEGIYAIVGESGSGKSTLAKVLTGVEVCDSGDLFWNDTRMVSASFFNDKEIRRNVHLVLQNSKDALNPKMSIYDCIAEPIRNLCKLDKSTEYQRVESLIKMVELDEKVLIKRAHELSGGELKRVNIARAIATNPQLIVFDEATSGLDVIVKKKILDLLKRIQEKNACRMLFITHDIEVALYMSKDIAVMQKGKIVERVQNVSCLSDFRVGYSKLLIDAMPVFGMSVTQVESATYKSVG